MSKSNSQREKSLELYKKEMSQLKKLPSDANRFQTMRKAQAIKEFNDKIFKMIEDTKRISAPSQKLDEIDHQGYNTVKVGSDFMPKTMDEITLIWEWTKRLNLDTCYQAREISMENQLRELKGVDQKEPVSQARSVSTKAGPNSSMKRASHDIK